MNLWTAASALLPRSDEAELELRGNYGVTITATVTKLKIASIHSGFPITSNQQNSAPAQIFQYRAVRAIVPGAFFNQVGQGVGHGFQALDFGVYLFQMLLGYPLDIGA